MITNKRFFRDHGIVHLRLGERGVLAPVHLVAGATMAALPEQRRP